MEFCPNPRWAQTKKKARELEGHRVHADATKYHQIGASCQKKATKHFLLCNEVHNNLTRTLFVCPCYQHPFLSACHLVVILLEHYINFVSPIHNLHTSHNCSYSTSGLPWTELALTSDMQSDCVCRHAVSCATYCTLVQESVVELNKLLLGLFGTEALEEVSVEVAELREAEGRRVRTPCC